MRFLSTVSTFGRIARRLLSIGVQLLIGGIICWYAAEWSLNSAPWWLTIVVAVAVTSSTIFDTTIYLHRALTHRSLEMSRLAEFIFRWKLWLETTQKREEWRAVHLEHHAHSDSKGDPHSPVLRGLWRVFFFNALYYSEAAGKQEILEKYARDFKRDGWDRVLFNRTYLGIGLGTALLILFLGPCQGIVAGFLHFLLYVQVAAPLINGLGHWKHPFAYQNFRAGQASTTYNNRVLAWLTGGESLHNNHHAFPRRPKFSIREDEEDSAWRPIRLLILLRLAAITPEGQEALQSA